MWEVKWVMMRHNETGERGTQWASQEAKSGRTVCKWLILSYVRWDFVSWTDHSVRSSYPSMHNSYLINHPTTAEV